ncbi:unnamed protein product [Parnassius apollo]|uniref:(apollo) hypothetical protein n=1 Tax=Parnassius apollo TaxID=110799 RepID=A0A8S3W2S2_PARAO|nr:unnamed protein product [Parnassius apollo]
MDLIRDQDKILQILKESDNDDDDSSLVPSDSELDDNLEEDLVENTDESEEKSSFSVEDLNVSRINRNRNRIPDSDDDSLEYLQPCPLIVSQENPVIQPERPLIYEKKKQI